MNYLDEYRQQTILGLFQAGSILIGSILIGSMLKAVGYTEGEEVSLLVIFVRNWGFTLIVIPLAWVLVTVWMERN